jgi:CheY-like chemotaxis protein
MRKILVVDDDPAFARMLQLNIESIGGYEAFTEIRGSHAVQTARESHPDLILMDLLMQDMLGGDAAIALLKDPATRHIRVVFLTALMNKSEEQQFIKGTGRPSYLAKPISRADLLAIFEQEFGSA